MEGSWPVDAHEENSCRLLRTLLPLGCGPNGHAWRPVALVESPACTLVLLLAPERAREHSAQQVLAPDLDLQAVEEVHGLVLEEVSARQTARALELHVGEDPSSGRLVVVSQE